MKARRKTILTFHGIGEPARPLEPGEQPYWISPQQYRSILDRIARHPDPGAIGITFDDGNLSDIEIAAPELVRRGLSAQFFVLAGRIGEPGSLSVADIRALKQSGMSIGSHGMDHVDWSRLGRGELERELRDSRYILEDITAAAVMAAAIPFGRYNAAVLKALRAAGYSEAYSSDGGSTASGRFPQSRTSVTASMTPATIADLLDGNENFTCRLRRKFSMIVKRYI